MKKIYLHQWIKQVGARHLAKKLGIAHSTISHWQIGRRCPSSICLYKIMKLSKGRVSADQVIKKFYGARR